MKKKGERREGLMKLEKAIRGEVVRKRQGETEVDRYMRYVATAGIILRGCFSC